MQQMRYPPCLWVPQQDRACANAALRVRVLGSITSSEDAKGPGVCREEEGRKLHRMRVGFSALHCMIAHIVVRVGELYAAAVAVLWRDCKLTTMRLQAMRLQVMRLQAMRLQAMQLPAIQLQTTRLQTMRGSYSSPADSS